MSEPISSISKIVELSSASSVNEYLQCGWKYLNSSPDYVKDHGGRILYSLAWYGEDKPVTPHSFLDQLPSNPDF